MTNVGLWDRWYASLRPGDAPEPYGLSDTYRLGAEWLADCALVEDWGCGKGWLRTLVGADRYRGVDGSQTPFADVIADLAGYRSIVPGVFMRHVLEHDFRWQVILRNALLSTAERMALILFTPLGSETRDIEWEPDPGVPNLSFALEDLEAVMVAAGARWTYETIESPAKYGTETIFRIEPA